ncbi:MAG: Ribonuclease HII [Legionellaceae bacterium]
MSQQEALIIAGVDEVGRGPLAGPVIAAAVILNPAYPILGLTDSKLLTEKKRELLFPKIQSLSLAWAIGRAEVHEIDTLNILNASLLAMQRAVNQLPIKPQHILVDGSITPHFNCTSEAIIKGDLTIPAISAASIIAKVIRDCEMQEWDKIYPGYGFADHKGYPTVKHRNALKMLGITPIHRQSFKPVKEFLLTNET